MNKEKLNRLNDMADKIDRLVKQAERYRNQSIQFDSLAKKTILKRDRVLKRLNTLITGEK